MISYNRDINLISLYIGDIGLFKAVYNLWIKEKRARNATYPSLSQRPQRHSLLLKRLDPRQESLWVDI